MVAPLNVMEDVLLAAEKMSGTHLDLHVERLRWQVSGRLNQEAWGAYCLEQMPLLTSPLAKAAVSMRNDIDLPIDRELYEKLVMEIVERTNARAKAAIAEIRSIIGGDPAKPSEVAPAEA